MHTQRVTNSVFSSASHAIAVAIVLVVIRKIRNHCCKFRFSYLVEIYDVFVFELEPPFRKLVDYFWNALNVALNACIVAVALDELRKQTRRQP